MHLARLVVVISGGLLAWPASSAVADKADRAAPGATASQMAAPPTGRYRCYQPPNYVVTAWFDLEAGHRYSVQGSEPAKFDWVPARSELRWRSGDFAGGRALGIYMPPGAKYGDQERATIVLAPRDGIKPGSAAWERLQRCYLTTH